MHQLNLITKVVGSPTEADLHFIHSEKARRYIRSLPSHPRASLQDMYPNCSPLAVDLINKMLVRGAAWGPRAAAAALISRARSLRRATVDVAPFPLACARAPPSAASHITDSGTRAQQCVQASGCACHPAAGMRQGDSPPHPPAHRRARRARLP